MRRTKAHYFYYSNKGTLGRLWKAGKRTCCYCGVQVTPNPPGVQTQVHNTATLEHLYSKLDMRRHAKDGNLRVDVACRKCNNERAAKEWTDMVAAYDAEWPITEIKLIDYV